MARILIVDDDPSVCRLLSRLVERLGHEARTAQTVGTGLEKARSLNPDLVLLDVRLPDGNGLEALPNIRYMPSSPEVIILTGQGNADGAEVAIRAGAWDYLQKPPTKDNVTLAVKRALDYRAEARKTIDTRTLDTSEIVGTSVQLRESLSQLAHASAGEASVLISGETGTGKELFAWAIHKNGPRKMGNFVVVDCAALPEGLVESTLFGHEKGAFTGADRSRKGLVLEADGGTLFLDEVGELPQSLQKAFLRVLQDRTFRPVGGKRQVSSDFRLISATNRALDRMVETGRFREDLLFRLRATTVDLPPLRRRDNDVRCLALYFLGKLCERYHLEHKGVSPEYLDLLAEYEWPGNVRELSNVIEHSLTEGLHAPVLFPKHLPTSLRVTLARASMAAKKESAAECDQENLLPGLDGTFKTFRDQVVARAEKTYLTNLMETSRKDIPTACERSGLSRARLYALLKKHGISRTRD